ncbi:MAG: DegT/DnrJ/EryC1/StrS family aminotransferase, partial [Bryobacteraceae bacterium]
MIQFNDFKRQWRDTGADTLAAVDAVGKSGWYILGDEVREFEKALAAAWGTLDAVGVASGLDAIELSLRALGCQPGDKVLTTPISAFATTLAIVKLGAVPVYVDCERFGLVDLDLCEE